MELTLIIKMLINKLIKSNFFNQPKTSKLCITKIQKFKKKQKTKKEKEKEKREVIHYHLQLEETFFQ